MHSILYKRIIMKPGPAFILLLFFIACFSCEKFPDSDPGPLYPENNIYFNSFESPSDTVGWYGISVEYLLEDSPVGGGMQSVQISGGCIIPHAYIWIDPLDEDCSLVLRCWGKNMSYGGSVRLIMVDPWMDDPLETVSISVQETSWTYYSSEDTLHYVAGSRLRIELNSGGIMASAMRVDQLEISKVDPQ